jgi:predicted SnoaL-like aldol condensation-catalyzing enzyme
MLGTQWTNMAAQNALLVRRVFTEIWNDGDLDLADCLFTPDYINHGGLIPDLVRGPEAIKVSVMLYRTAFPLFRLTVIDLLAEGQIVAVRWAARSAPDQAECREAPGGRSEALLGMTFGRVSGGQIAESWTCWDTGNSEASGMARHIQTLARSAC